MNEKTVIFSILIALVFFSTLVSAQLIEDLKPCLSGQKRPCGSDIGACRPGISECKNNRWGECVGGVMPMEEICDNQIDDDCDGLVDECLSFYIVIAVIGVIFFFMMWLLSRIH